MITILLYTGFCAWQWFSKWTKCISHLFICVVLHGGKGCEKITQERNLTLAANQKFVFWQQSWPGMTHWQLEARFLFIEVGSGTLEPVWGKINHRNTVTCTCLLNPFLHQAFIYFYAEKLRMHTFSVAHICMCVCVCVCVCVCTWLCGPFSFLVSSIRWSWKALTLELVTYKFKPYIHHSLAMWLLSINLHSLSLCFPICKNARWKH